MLRFLRHLFARPDPAALFRADQPALLALWFRTTAATGLPKGLTWQAVEPLGEPLFGKGWAVLPVLVTFEPILDGPLSDVPHAREPRPVVAVFRFARREWSTSGRVVFNLSAERVAASLRR
jgi:hypothetical protein